MQPKKWGRGIWLIIFCALYNDTKFGNLDKLKEFLDSICRNLPCSNCSNNIIEEIKKNNIMSEENLYIIKNFFIRIHNETPTSKKIILS